MCPMEREVEGIRDELNWACKNNDNDKKSAAKAENILKSGKAIIGHPDGSFSVPSEKVDGKYYTVTPFGRNDKGEHQFMCNCPHFLFRAQNCKHILAVSPCQKIKDEEQAAIVSGAVVTVIAAIEKAKEKEKQQELWGRYEA